MIIQPPLVQNVIPSATWVGEEWTTRAVLTALSGRLPKPMKWLPPFSLPCARTVNDTTRYTL